MSLRLISLRRLSPKPISESTPGRKFSTSTSARSSSRDSTALPSSLRRSRTTERLLRLKLAKYQESPLTTSPWPRTVSPCAVSILTTSAPMSARSMVENGPDSTRVRSITRMPVRGWIMASVLSAKILAVRGQAARIFDPSAGPSVSVLGGAPADVPLSHVLRDRRPGAGLGVAKAAASRFDNAHALPWRQLVAALGMHGLAVDGVHPERSIAAAEQTARGKQGPVAHAERGDGMPRIVAQDDLLAKATAPLSRAARVGQQPLALD